MSTQGDSKELSEKEKEEVKLLRAKLVTEAAREVLQENREEVVRRAEEKFRALMAKGSFNGA